ncbi:uncharacterized protein METZ01_LOCUS410688, partial [marine metagenome]
MLGYLWVERLRTMLQTPSRSQSPPGNDNRVH